MSDSNRKFPARSCITCSNEYQPTREWQKFCTNRCRYAYADSQFAISADNVVIRGKPLKSLTREELIDALLRVVQSVEQEGRLHRRILEMWRLRKGGRRLKSSDKR